MDNDRTGALGVEAVKTYILNAGYMKSDIRHNDNIPIWDGDIYVYSCEDDLNNNNFSFRVPTQVKSHFYGSGKFPENVRFSIDTKNLKNYSAEGGVIFFFVYVRKNESQIYVEYLTRKKIKNTLKGKENQKTISVQFNRIATDTNIFLQELRSWNLQRQYIVKSITDFNPQETLELIFDKNRYGLHDASEKQISHFLASHSVDVLIRNKDSNDLYYPEEGRLKISKLEKVDGTISYHNTQICVEFTKMDCGSGYLYTIHGGWLSIFKPLNSDICISFNVNYKYSTFREVSQMAHIMNLILNSKRITIDNEVLQIPTFNDSDKEFINLRKTIDFWLRFDRLCKVLHIFHDFSVKYLSTEDINKFEMLYAAYIDKKEVTSSRTDNHISLTILCDLHILSYVNITHDNKARLTSFSDNLMVAYKSSDNSQKPLIATTFSAAFSYEYIPSNIQLDNICAAYTEAYNQNPDLINRANFDLLNLINHFDRTQYPELLHASLQLSQWILSHCEEESERIHRLNHIQILIRNGDKLSDETIDWLSSIYDKSDDQFEKFVCAILLNEHYRAKRIFLNFSEQDKLTISNWPILKLFNTNM